MIFLLVNKSHEKIKNTVNNSGNYIVTKLFQVLRYVWLVGWSDNLSLGEPGGKTCPLRLIRASVMQGHAFLVFFPDRKPIQQSCSKDPGVFSQNE